MPGSQQSSLSNRGDDMIWRFKTNKAKVAAGMNRIIDYRPDGTIWLWVTDHWAETELASDVPIPPPPPPPPPVNHPPVAGDTSQTIEVHQ